MKKFRLLSVILSGVIIATTIVGCGSTKAANETASTSTKTEQSKDASSTKTSEESKDTSTKTETQAAKPDFETKKYSGNGVSFSYPADWKVDTTNAPILLMTPTGKNPNNCSINFLLQEAGEKLPAYSAYVEVLKPSLAAKFQNSNVTAEEYNDGVNKGAKFTITGELKGQKLKMMQIHIFEGTKVAMFTYGGKVAGFDSFTKQANYIASTFKLEK